jgi:hypothetical protein
MATPPGDEDWVPVSVEVGEEVSSGIGHLDRARPDDLCVG